MSEGQCDKIHSIFLKLRAKGETDENVLCAFMWLSECVLLMCLFLFMLTTIPRLFMSMLLRRSFCESRRVVQRLSVELSSSIFYLGFSFARKSCWPRGRHMLAHWQLWTITLFANIYCAKCVYACICTYIVSMTNYSVITFHGDLSILFEPAIESFI